MKPLPHYYEATLQSCAAVPEGTASAERLPPLRLTPPPEYDGAGDAWSPEHLLLASVGACFAFTFRAVARAARCAYDRLDVRVSGTVSRPAGATRFTEIVVRASVTVRPGTNRDRLRDVIEKAEDHCLISNSLTTPVRVDSEILEEERVKTACAP